jgi:hypothetical protein
MVQGQAMGSFLVLGYTLGSAAGQICRLFFFEDGGQSQDEVDLASHKVTSEPTRATQRNPVSNKQTNKQTTPQNKQTNKKQNR